MTHLTVEKAAENVNHWRAREEMFAVTIGFIVGHGFGDGWEDVSGHVAFVIGILLVWFICFSRRIRAGHQLEIAFERRDEYREKRWQEMHDTEVADLHD